MEEVKVVVALLNVKLNKITDLMKLAPLMSEWLDENRKGWPVIATQHKGMLPDKIAKKPDALSLVFLFSEDAVRKIMPKKWVFGGVYDNVAIGQYKNGFSSVVRNKIDGFAHHLTSYNFGTQAAAHFYNVIAAVHHDKGKK